jgi:hypothetical protein
MLYANPAPLSFGNSQTWRDLFFGQNPALAYRNYLRAMGVDFFSPFGQFAQDQFEPLYADYSLSALDKPFDYSFTQFLNEHGLEGLRRQFQGLSPEQRGSNPNRFVGPVRYIGI